MSQHTPAPWTIEPAHDRRVYLVNHGSEADPVYKAGAVAQALKKIRAAIERAEKETA